MGQEKEKEEEKKMKGQRRGGDKVPRGATFQVTGHVPKFLRDIQLQHPGLAVGGSGEEKAPKRRKPSQGGDDWSDEEREVIKRAMHEAGMDGDEEVTPEKTEETEAPHAETRAEEKEEEQRSKQVEEVQEPEAPPSGERKVMRKEEEHEVSHTFRKPTKPKASPQATRTIQAKAVRENKQLLSFGDD